jgi:hypothetical protein
MPNIIGEPLKKYVQNQITQRQKAHGSGVDGNRTPEQLSYLNSKTAWVKLASGIAIDSKKYTSNIREDLKEWDNLAKKYVLFGGISEWTSAYLKQRGTYNDGSNNIWDYYKGTYNISATLDNNETTGEFGLVPMPGIVDASIKCENRGSIKKATVNIKCYSPEQFKIIDTLYLRIGYTMFLEWGWAPYLDNNGNIQHDYTTLIENENGFFSSTWNSQPYSRFLSNIESYRKGKNGNYDGLLCKVTNFSWTFDQNGNYDIQLNLISLGDVIESLKINLVPPLEMSQFIDVSYRLYSDDDESSETNIPPSPAGNVITAYFFFQKIFLTEEGLNPDYFTADECKSYYGNGEEPLPVPTKFIKPSSKSKPLTTFNTRYENYENKDELNSILEELGNDKEFFEGGFGDIPENKYGTFYSYDKDEESGLILIAERFKFDFDSDQDKKDFLYCSYNTLTDDEDLLNEDGLYIRFGHLLDFVQSNAIPKIKNSNDPIIQINTNTQTNKMYVFPYQVSLDPRVCIVKSEEDISKKQYYTKLPKWKVVDETKGTAYGKTMNIYLNCNFISRIVNEKQDERGNISLYEFLESICSELNKALGGVNNLEPTVDEDTGIINILDASYSSIKKDKYVLELYGYNGDTSNFVYDFNIKTEITNDFATMASVGSTAGGYVKGTENTMFSKWNKGLVDRFKTQYIPPAITKDKSQEIEKEPPQIYYEEFWIRRFHPFGVTPPQDIVNDVSTSDSCALSYEIIDKNITLVNEFYKYCQSAIQQKYAQYSSPFSGFIPISLGLTLEGISGIKIYNYLNVSTRFLPSNYPEALKFIVKGVNHKIADGKWETSIETVVIANNSDEDGKPFLSYNQIKNEVDLIRKEGENSSKVSNNENQQYTPPVRLANTSPEALAAAVSSGAGFAATTIGGVGSKTLGTAGKDAPVANLSRDALSAKTIEQLVEDSGAGSSVTGGIIRSRIVRIAASYVGQFEIENPGQNIHGNKKTYSQNPGWWDPDYQAKFANSNPKLQYGNWTPPEPWCAWFCQVVWREAYTTGNAYVDPPTQYATEYKDIWNNYLSAGGAITAGVAYAKANFQKLKKFITLQDAITGKSLPEPGDIAVYSYGHVDLVVKPFITDGKLTGFSAIGGNTGAGDARNGGETKYYSKKYDWKQVVGFCKVVDPFNKDTDYASSPPSGLPSADKGNTKDAPAKQPTFEELQEKSASAFNSLTYRLALIWKLKDNYGSNGKYLFYNYKGGNDDEEGAVEAVKNWMKKSEQQNLLNKLTDNDREQFNKYLTQLYTRTRTGGDDVTFKSAYNKRVKDKTIDPDF